MKIIKDNHGQDSTTVKPIHCPDRLCLPIVTNYLVSSLQNPMRRTLRTEGCFAYEINFLDINYHDSIFHIRK